MSAAKEICNEAKKLLKSMESVHDSAELAVLERKASQLRERLKQERTRDAPATGRRVPRLSRQASSTFRRWRGQSPSRPSPPPLRRGQSSAKPAHLAASVAFAQCRRSDYERPAAARERMGSYMSWMTTRKSTISNILSSTSSSGEMPASRFRTD